MENEMIEKYAIRIRKVANGLKWYTIFSLVGGGLSLIFNMIISEEAEGFEGVFVSELLMALGVVLDILAIVVYVKIKNAAKKIQLPSKDLTQLALWIFGGNCLLQISTFFTQEQLPLEEAIYYLPALLLAILVVGSFVGWMYYMCVKWRNVIEHQRND